MNCVYWNIKGIGNPSSKLAFKRLCTLHKPSFFFIAEPWMHFHKFPKSLLNSVNMKFFAVNDRGTNDPNLWCFCSSDINPTVLHTSNQHVSFMIKISEQNMVFSAIYASTDYQKRRDLWAALNAEQSNGDLPRCFIGDFNTILGMHEYRGSNTPSRICYEDFQDWTNSHNLIHLPTKGAHFTWANGRRGRSYTEKQLDRSVCNTLFIDAWSSISCNTLIKSESDHYPIMLHLHNNNNVRHASPFKFLRMWSKHDDCVNVVKQERVAKLEYAKALHFEEDFWREKARIKWHTDGDRNTQYFHQLAKVRYATKLISSLRNGDDLITNASDIESHVVNYFKDIFSSPNMCLDNGIIDQVIPNLITDDQNISLTCLPSMQEVHDAVFSMNKDGAPGPDGFGAIFYQTYWDIIANDVYKAVLQFFSNGWILPNYNSNNVVLIPKSHEADAINHFRPIALANFKFKIISKILASRLAMVAPTIISSNQRGFIPGRQISDCICLTSEAINMLNNKNFGGNLAMKIDIRKAFDTLDWDFLLKVLHTFGFSPVFCNWIKVILHSACLSIVINGRPSGYFTCRRGVRQGDPLSPILFCLAEEVLSRSITKLVEDGSLQLIPGTRGNFVPSHILYADDVMIFCRATLANINILKGLFQRYGEASGQIINPSKSTFYVGSISATRTNRIADMLGFSIGTLPFIYLGVPIFKGKPKACHLQPIADRIKAKLAAWKASLLSIAGRVQIVKSIIHGMLIYSFMIYAWPISLLKDVDRWIRNFIWSGNVDQRKLVNVAWDKVCTPTNEGGLGLRSLRHINEAANLKLCWELFTSSNHWVSLLRARVMRSYGIHHFESF
ncbi:unnamed protein product [Trifolium pratense]|uniref:Uncharacterized protein n=1 Tax=Trifolium pratense TaxID=57577 RepID=A0ACB0JNJ2_TRIPR|nr:unnamed protein product [Trifolium pratense]